MNTESQKPEEGPTYEDAVFMVIRDQRPSASYLQRRLGVRWVTADEWLSNMAREGICTDKGFAGIRGMLVSAPDQDQ